MILKKSFDGGEERICECAILEISYCTVCNPCVAEF